MKKDRAPMILTAASIVLLLLLLGYVKMASGRTGEDQILDGLSPVTAGFCWGDDGNLYPCVKYVRKGFAGFYLAILSQDTMEVIVIVRIVGGAQVILWRKGGLP